MSVVATAPGLSIVSSFDDIEAAVWARLLAASPSDVVFLTLAWQRRWWHALGGEKLLIVLAHRGRELRAIAPMFAMQQMLYLVGSGGSDYLDFIGDLDEETLAAMLEAAIAEVPGFKGISLFHIPQASPTTALLPGVAERLGTELCAEGELEAPYVDLSDASRVNELTARRRLRREEERMRREAPLEIRTASAADLDPWLDQFLAQHEQQWHETDDAVDPRFLRAIVHDGHGAGWLRFMMLEWNGRPAAFDISLLHGDRYLAYLVSRDTSITRYSPGKVLEGHAVRDACASGARWLDLGLGDEAYKLAHASGSAWVGSWALWPA